MAFEGLSDKLAGIFKNLRGKGKKLSEDDVKLALKRSKDGFAGSRCKFKIVKQFISSVQEKAIGEKVFESLLAQTVIKIVNEELVSLMGTNVTELPMKPGGDMVYL